MALSGLFLDVDGLVAWAMPCGSSGAKSSSSLSAGFVDPLDHEAGVVSSAGPRRRGRLRKAQVPQDESLVKHSLRSNSQGYNYEMLPYQPSRRKISKVPAATPPQVLQIEEMQHIGVEDCQIDPAELSVEKLMKERGAQE